MTLLMDRYNSQSRLYASAHHLQGVYTRMTACVETITGAIIYVATKEFAYVDNILIYLFLSSIMIPLPHRIDKCGGAVLVEIHHAFYPMHTAWTYQNKEAGMI